MRFLGVYGGRDKNWTYDLYDVNVAFYHWTTRPKNEDTFNLNRDFNTLLTIF